MVHENELAIGLTVQNQVSKSVEDHRIRSWRFKVSGASVGISVAVAMPFSTSLTLTVLPLIVARTTAGAKLGLRDGFDALKNTSLPRKSYLVIPSAVRSRPEGVDRLCPRGGINNYQIGVAVLILQSPQPLGVWIHDASRRCVRQGNRS